MAEPIKAILAEHGSGGGTGSTVQLLGIAVTTPPTKTSYIAGETFNPAGMVVTASYGMSGIVLAETPVTGYTVEPSPLTDGTTRATIRYSELGVEQTTTTPVTVTHRVTAITVTNNSKTTYEYGDNFDVSKLTTRATYSDGATANVNVTCPSPALTTRGSSIAVTVRYTENGYTVETTTNVTVTRKTVTAPSWKGSFTYDGTQKSATSTSNWNNYNTSYMSLTTNTSGDVSQATNAGTYYVTFSASSNYRFGTSGGSDVTTSRQSWSIAKLAVTVSASPTSLAIDGSNLTKTSTITLSNSLYDGTPTVSPTSYSGLTSISVSKTQFSVTGNGSTAISSASFTLSFPGTTNCTISPSTITVTVSASYWSWGSETATGDATWWANLKNWIASASTSELSACVGKTKSVTLTSAVQGTTSHLVRCVAYNCDRDKSNPTANTLTFHTANCLANLTAFGSSNGKWNGSTVRNLCTNYYNAFPGKNSIVTTRQKTATETNSNQTATATAQDETVFLPSDCEMGFPAGHDYSNGKGYAASYDEYDEKNTSKTAYQYYTTNDRRIKKQGDSGSAQYYWERSLYYDSTSGACFVANDGKPYGGHYDNSDGFAPAFVI